MRSGWTSFGQYLGVGEIEMVIVPNLCRQEKRYRLAGSDAGGFDGLVLSSLAEVQS